MYICTSSCQLYLLNECVLSCPINYVLNQTNCNESCPSYASAPKLAFNNSNVCGASCSTNYYNSQMICVNSSACQFWITGLNSMRACTDTCASPNKK